MKSKFFVKLELPHHKEKEFEDFLLKGIDFKTGKRIILHSEDVMNTSSNKVQQYIDHGNDTYFCGFYEAALKAYALALSIDPKQIDAWVGQIRTLIDIGKYDAALFWVNRALEQLAQVESLDFAKAFVLAYSGKVEEATKIINRPIKKHEPTMLWLFRGEILLKLRLNFFQKLIKPYKGIGKIGAFFCFLKALEPNPKDGFMNQRIGIAYLMTNDVSNAYEHLRTSLIAAPQNPLTLYCLAECYRKKFNFQYAKYYTKKAIAYNPELDAAIELLNWLHRPQTKFIARLRQIVKKETT